MARVLIIPGLAVQRYARPGVHAISAFGHDVSLLPAPAWRATSNDLTVYGRDVGAEIEQLISYASLKTDIANAGGSWIDQSVVVDDTDGWTLITSRNPDDLPDFLSRIETALTNAISPQRPDQSQ
jgi:hypothetical protein